MAGPNTQLKFPRGQLRFGSGDLRRITDIDLTLTNGAKVVPTNRGGNVGIVFGNLEVKLSFKVVLDDAGSEVGYLAMVKEKQVNDWEVRTADGPIRVTVAIDTLQYSAPVADPQNYSVSCVGIAA